MKKNLNSIEFWDAFGRSLVLDRSQWPTPKEASEIVLNLMAQVAAKDKEIEGLKHEMKCQDQQFDTFILEVGNVANKYRRNK